MTARRLGAQLAGALAAAAAIRWLFHPGPVVTRDVVMPGDDEQTGAPR